MQRIRFARPEHRRCDLALYEPCPRGGNRIVASDAKHGIRVGMPLAEAKAQAAIRFEEHDPLADQMALRQIAAWCEEFSPTVGIEGSDTICMDITGLARLFGNEELLAVRIKSAFQQRSLSLRLAIADTLGASWALAHFGKTPIIVPPGQFAIKDLPVAALRLEDELELLGELGIHRVSQLLTLPREALASRFGPQILQRLDQATGFVPETITSHRPPPEIAIETRLEYPLDDRQALELLLNELIGRVAQSLSKRQQGAIQLRCELNCDGMTAQLDVGLYRASANPKHLFALLQMQLDQKALSGPVTAVKVAVLMAAPLLSQQQELFESSCREERRQVGLLIDRLSNRLGRESVVRALPQSDVQPELAFRYEPLAGVLPRKNSHRWKTLPRPLCLETSPIPLEVLSVIPDGPPVQFRWAGNHRVAHAWGPERIQTGWWRGCYVQRDYYRIETTEGKRFWVFRRLSDAKWFLHGVFD